MPQRTMDDDERTGRAAARGGCAAIAAECKCALPGSHEVHMCDCGGQWTGTEPDFDPVRLPQRVMP